jgi:hypothetical protein
MTRGEGCNLPLLVQRDAGPPGILVAATLLSPGSKVSGQHLRVPPTCCLNSAAAVFASSSRTHLLSKVPSGVQTTEPARDSRDHNTHAHSAEADVARGEDAERGNHDAGPASGSSTGDAGSSPGQAISSSIHFVAASRAAAWASAGDAARFRNGTTIPLWLRGSCSGFQTSTLAENLVSTAVSVMRIFQPRNTCSDLLALDSVMEDHLRHESTSAGDS